MAGEGKLNLELVDVYGDRISERVDVALHNQGLAERLLLRNVDASKKVAITNLQSGPHGLYRIEIDPPSYLPVNRFFRVPSGRSGELHVTCPVDHSKVRLVEFPKFATLHADYVRLLGASMDVLGFANVSGEDLYNNLDDLRKAGMLNILAKSARTRYAGGKSVVDYLHLLQELRQDRFFVRISKELRDETKNSVASGLFIPASATLHSAPDGFISAGSFKTDDHYGNLQLTFWQRGEEWMADIDIDDASGLAHVFQVVRNSLSGRPTHPFDIHQILIAYQEIDPGYRLVVHERKARSSTTKV